MKPGIAFDLAALGAIAAISALAAGPAQADDITIDPTPFVSTQSRADVRAQIMKRAPTEWDRHAFEAYADSGYTRAQAREEYVTSRREVWERNAEHSGSMPLNWKTPSPTRVMGGPAR